MSSKYGNVRTSVCGKTFDSKKEAARYLERLQQTQLLTGVIGIFGIMFMIIKSK